MIPAILECCAGIDVGKKFVMVCVLKGPANGEAQSQIRRFGTTNEELNRLREWVKSCGCTHVVMESTGEYWRPIFNVLEEEESLQVILANSKQVKALRGHKTDPEDAHWLAYLLRHGLIRPSFIPPKPIRELRDLTRYRKAQIDERGREAQRLDKVLQDAGIKLSSVATDILGKSGRDMLAALISGTRDPQVLAELARGRLRTKIPLLRRALEGRFVSHHRLIVEKILAKLDFLDETIADLSAEIDRLIAPFAAEVDLLDTITGVDRRAAECIIAESGRTAALLRRSPLRTVHAACRGTRLKQAARASRDVVLAACVCELEARGSRWCVSGGFYCRAADLAGFGGRDSRQQWPCGRRSATSVPTPVGIAAADLR